MRSYGPPPQAGLRTGAQVYSSVLTNPTCDIRCHILRNTLRCGSSLFYRKRRLRVTASALSPFRGTESLWPMRQAPERPEDRESAPHSDDAAESGSNRIRWYVEPSGRMFAGIDVEAWRCAIRRSLASPLRHRSGRFIMGPMVDDLRTRLSWSGPHATK